MLAEVVLAISVAAPAGFRLAAWREMAVAVWCGPA
jgi:hypothetical protein